MIKQNQDNREVVSPIFGWEENDLKDNLKQSLDAQSEVILALKGTT